MGGGVRAQNGGGVGMGKGGVRTGTWTGIGTHIRTQIGIGTRIVTGTWIVTGIGTQHRVTTQGQ